MVLALRDQMAILAVVPVPSDHLVERSGAALLLMEPSQEHLVVQVTVTSNALTEVFAPGEHTAAQQGHLHLQLVPGVVVPTGVVTHNIRLMRRNVSKTTEMILARDLQDNKNVTLMVDMDVRATRGVMDLIFKT